MAPVRFACFLALLLFAASLSNIGHASQDGNAVAELDSVSTGKGREGVFAGADGVENRLGRRKLEVYNTVMKLEEKEADHRKGGIGGTLEISTTSTQVTGKCTEIKDEKEGSNVECKHGVSSPSVQEKVDHDEAGFVAFNADYHAPRQHPPKNN